MTKFPSWIFIDDSTLSRAYVRNTIRSEMEVGPNKTRPNQSVPLFNIQMSIAFRSDRLQEFNQWFYGDIRNGTSWFLLTDPFDGVEKRFRFLTEEFTWSKSGTLLKADITLEAYDAL